MLARISIALHDIHRYMSGTYVIEVELNKNKNRLEHITEMLQQFFNHFDPGLGDQLNNAARIRRDEIFFVESQELQLLEEKRQRAEAKSHHPARLLDAKDPDEEEIVNQVGLSVEDPMPKEWLQFEVSRLLAETRRLSKLVAKQLDLCKPSQVTILIEKKDDKTRSRLTMGFVTTIKARRPFSSEKSPDDIVRKILSFLPINFLATTMNRVDRKTKRLLSDVKVHGNVLVPISPHNHIIVQNIEGLRYKDILKKITKIKKTKDLVDTSIIVAGHLGEEKGTRAANRCARNSNCLPVIGGVSIAATIGSDCLFIYLLASKKIPDIPDVVGFFLVIVACFLLLFGPHFLWRGCVAPRIYGGEGDPTFTLWGRVTARQERSRAEQRFARLPDAQEQQEVKGSVQHLVPIVGDSKENGDYHYRVLPGGSAARL